VSGGLKVNILRLSDGQKPQTVEPTKDDRDHTFEDVDSAVELAERVLETGFSL
jgi:hypothetical protein